MRFYLQIETKYCNDIQFYFISIESNEAYAYYFLFDHLNIFLFGLIKIELLCAILG